MGVAITRIPVAIGNGAATSSEADLREFSIIAIEMPAAFTGATFSFTSTAQPEPTATFLTVVDDAGGAVSITATDNRYIVLTAATAQLLAGLARTKIVSASNEGAARTVTLVCIPNV